MLVETKNQNDPESLWLSSLMIDCCLIAVSTGDSERIKRLIKIRKKTMLKKWKTTNSVLKKLIKSRDVSEVIRLGFNEIDPLKNGQINV